MNIVLIDDEEVVRRNMRNLIGKYTDDAKIIGEADSVSSGLELLQNQNPDIVFLDVEMQDGTGFDLLAQHGEADFQVIFVTGHDRYAIRAFQYSATDYLLKPVSPTELMVAWEKAKKRDFNLIRSGLQTLMENEQLHKLEKKLILKDKETVYVMPIKEIVRCEADNNYTVFYTIDGKKLTISKTLKEYERLFDDLSFFRSHQSHLINLSFVQKYEKRDGGTIHLTDGSTVPLASKKKAVFLEKLDNL